MVFSLPENYTIYDLKANVRMPLKPKTYADSAEFAKLERMRMAPNQTMGEDKNAPKNNNKTINSSTFGAATLPLPIPPPPTECQLYPLPPPPPCPCKRASLYVGPNAFDTVPASDKTLTAYDTPCGAFIVSAFNYHCAVLSPFRDFMHPARAWLITTGLQCSLL